MKKIVSIEWAFLHIFEKNVKRVVDSAVGRSTLCFTAAGGYLQSGNSEKSLLGKKNSKKLKKVLDLMKNYA